MPRFDNTAMDVAVQKLPGSAFQFSAVKMASLGASEYTLVTIAIDVSGSIGPFQGNLVTMLNTIVDACRKSPRADNLLLRVLAFNHDVREVHGFIPLASVIAYDAGDLQCSGSTALFDAAYSAISATKAYGAQLADQDYDVNAIAFIATDGDDNASSFTPAKIAAELKAIASEEKLESFTTVLIGMGTSAQGLQAFHADAGLTQFVDLGDITAGKLSKLAGMTSKSISSTSQSLGTGAAAPLQSLTF